MEKKILLAEDDKNFLWILKQSFITEGFKVATAEDGQMAVEMAQSENPDIILLDILMPKMDGVAAAKKIKELGVKAPIMFLTNLKDVQHVSEAISSMKDTDYLVKSDLHIDSIVSIVKDKLKGK